MFAIATDHVLSSMAAKEVVEKGGNAVDAAVAAAAALSVLDPYMSGLGGFGVAVMRVEGRNYGLNFIGTAPHKLKLEDLTAEKPWEDFRPTFEGPNSFLVPGSVAGWGTMHDRFGRLKWEEVLSPALRLAKGHEVTERIWEFYSGIRDSSKFESTARTFYPGGRFPSPGEVLRQPELEATLRTLAQEGWRSMYSGTLGQRIAEHVQNLSGSLSQEDLKRFSPTWVDLCSTNYDEYVVYSLPAGTAGPTVLEWLNIMDQLNPPSHWTSGQFAHLFLEAGKLALRDDDAYNTGKDYYRVPIEMLLDKRHAMELAKMIGNEAKFYSLIRGPVYGLHTTSLSTMVGEDLVSMTLTQMYGFDRNGLLGDLGFSMNDGMCYFSLDPSDKERFEPGQRPRYPLAPVIAEGKGMVTLGAAGGWTIPQTVTLTLLKVLRYKEDVDRAVNSPRLVMRYRTNSIPYPPGTVVEVEEELLRSIGDSLRSRGHTVIPAKRLGAVNGVQQSNGKLSAGAEGRRGGEGFVGQAF